MVAAPILIALAGGSGAVVGAMLTQLVSWRQARRTEAIEEQRKTQELNRADQEKFEVGFEFVTLDLLKLRQAFGWVSHQMFGIQEYGQNDSTIKGVQNASKDLFALCNDMQDRLRLGFYRLAGSKGVQVADALFLGGYTFGVMFSSYLDYAVQTTRDIQNDTVWKLFESDAASVGAALDIIITEQHFDVEIRYMGMDVVSDRRQRSDSRGSADGDDLH